MKLPNRPARLNRALLFVAGVVLLAAGAFELASRPRPWVAYVAVTVSIVIGLAALRWLAAQVLRRPRTQVWRLPVGPGRGVTTMHADAAAAPLVAEVGTYEESAPPPPG